MVCRDRVGQRIHTDHRENRAKCHKGEQHSGNLMEKVLRLEIQNGRGTVSSLFYGNKSPVAGEQGGGMGS